MGIVSIITDGLFAILNFFINVYYGGLHNKYNVLTLPINFFINFLPVFTWLTIFKQAGGIPISWRPKIHGKLSFYGDMFMFGDFWGEILQQGGSQQMVNVSFVVSVVGFVLPFLVFLPFVLWYYIYYIRRSTRNFIMYHLPFNKPITQLPIFFIPFFVWCALNFDHIFAKQLESNFTDGKNMLSWIFYVLCHLLAPIFTSIYLYVFKAPGTLACFSYTLGIQNIAGVFTHLLIPMAPPWFTHMYGLHNYDELNYDTPGYAAGLTRVNFSAGTHLASAGFHKSPIVFGAVPSLHSAIAFQCFIYIWSQTWQGDLTYWKRGFSNTTDETLIGSTNAVKGKKLGNTQLKNSEEFIEEFDLENLHDDSVSPSPNPFDMDDAPKDDAQRTIFSKIVESGYISRVIVSVFLIIQWWATMYLDHHYRFDLFIGCTYSIISFFIINHFYLQRKIIPSYLSKRSDLLDTLKEDPHDQEGRSMGMRVFQNTKIEWVFDSLKQ